MTGTFPSSQEERLQREARVSGLSHFQTPSLEAVERRRVQLWTVTLLLLLGAAAAIVMLSMWPGAGTSQSFTTPPVVGIAVLVVSVAFCTYVIEKERSLRRLTSLLIDERVLSAAFSNRLKEISALATLGKAVNSVLNLEDVLHMILSSALELLEGGQGSIMLLEEPNQLRTVCAIGNDQALGAHVEIGKAIAGRVAESREPILLSGRADSSMFPGLVERAVPVDSSFCVPLINRDELLGVLNVSAAPDRSFSEYELRAFNLFAEHAALAIANARLYEAEIERVAELVEVSRLKSQFVATVSHELRTPLTAIIGSVITLRNLEMDEEQHDEFLATIERQGRRLLRLIEELLVAAQLEREGAARPMYEPIDVAELTRTIVRDLAAGSTPVEVLAPREAVVMTDPDILQRILTNLIDNALKHGSPPVRVEVWTANDEIHLSVVDAGPGIPSDERERIFERFTRLDGSGNRPGIGLGLPIVRELLAACGGRVWVEAPANGGSAFRVMLPGRVPERRTA
jgi:K+-sensing histidine kinase KdpD